MNVLIIDSHSDDHKPDGHRRPADWGKRRPTGTDGGRPAGNVGGTEAVGVDGRRPGRHLIRVTNSRHVLALNSRTGPRPVALVSRTPTTEPAPSRAEASSTQLLPSPL